MFDKVTDADFVRGEHEMLRFWQEQDVFAKLRAKNQGKPKWSFLDGPITANNPMGVHHAWGRTYKDAYQRYFAMTGHELRYQNGFDCQGLWVEVEVERELGQGTKNAIAEYGIDKFVNACKQRVLKFAARQTEQSIRLGYWMDWDNPEQLRKLAETVGTDQLVEFTAPSGKQSTDVAHRIVEKLGNAEWGGSYFTFSTENNETIWTFLKKCFQRKKIYQGHDVMPWSGRGGSAYSQMEVADGRKLTTHRSCFVRFPIIDKATQTDGLPSNEYLLVWTTTPWTLTSNVACAVNPDLDYVKIRTKRDGAVYYFAKDNLEYQRLGREHKEGFGRPEWKWPEGVPKLKTIAQFFKEQGGYEEEGTIKGADMIGWRYRGPLDDLPAQKCPLGDAEKERFSRWQHSFSGIVNSILKGIQTRASDDLSRIHKLRASSEVSDHWLSVNVAEINCHRFFEDIQSLFQNFGLVGSALIDKHYDPQARKKLILNLKDFGVSASTTDRIDKYRVELDTLLGTSEDSGLDQQLLNAQGLSEEWILEFIAAQPSIAREIFCELSRIPERLAFENHRIVRGGTDSKGNQTVTAGEGSGIVHIAPGCGDIDHTIGKRLFIHSIAPLKEDGRFSEGFGDFTGREAIDSATAELVFEKLREQHLLVAVETYPHIYPHCWRTGDELVFRLVDEWFINMDWRDEIKDVVKNIRWLPDSIQGQERETEWLSNMSDWMISKKRFWGLALPIWFNEDDPTDFEVIGSLKELEERAVEGWDDFKGNTPHRPWIDKVKIRSSRTGALLQRVEDVGNPWLDAGIVPFSTLNYNENYPTSVLKWKDWYPADFVTECFPGQFRNWFYSLLALSTMMRHGEADPVEKRPFKTLLGHRLVMDEQGRPMHKSDGTAIWFEEAAEQLGVDTLRWMYLAQNPAVDLRFGTRHPDEKVTLETPDGPISQTREGLPTCLVTSKPADEIRRQILIPLWNSYAFFVNYAIPDGFDPSTLAVPVSDRPLIDQWILSNLQAFLKTANERFADFDASAVCQAAAGFIEDLSNWYIRRNRRRFWRSQQAGDKDKLAAYQTLYAVLVALTKALAPCIPFLTERMYRNLVCNSDPSAPESVHLCDYPQPDTRLLNPELNLRMASAQRVVGLGHKLRDAANLRVRQPLAELRYACSSTEMAARIESLSETIADELNVKKLTRAENLDDLVRYSYKPNLKTLGPKYGKLLNAIRQELPSLPAAQLDPLRKGEPVTVTIGGEQLALQPDDVMVSTEQAADWVCADDAGVQIALSTVITPELKAEGIARDFVRQVQQLRKDANLEIEDRIRILYDVENAEVAAAIEEWGIYICGETQADALGTSDRADDMKDVAVGDATAWLVIERK